jgi:hypothetical protein
MRRWQGILAWAVFAGVVPAAQASFHLMQIEQVVGGVGGDPSAQAIQLRMRAAFQNLVGQARLVVRDAGGANPVLLLDFPADVFNEGAGLRVLVTSPAMAGVTSPPVSPDFTLTNTIPASYFAAGSLTFEDNFNTIYWRLSWGNYTGPTTGSITNDADGQFGPAFAAPLPSWEQGLLFQGAAAAPSTNNLADYALSAGPAVLTNNDGASFAVAMPTDAPPRIALEPLSNRPNPFNPSTEIVFGREQPGEVSLRIYDLRGRLVTTLFEGRAPAGEQRLVWNGLDRLGRPVASGAFVAQLWSPGRVEMRKLTLAR